MSAPPVLERVLNGATYMSPDLIGEVRIVVAPVDAEMGRGNGQFQFLTRSGGNEYHGTGVWTVRNTALDANTWANNRAVDPKTGAWKPTQPNWYNNHQFTASLGGPIVKNKTFFFALWDSALMNGRTIQNPVVLTPCARRGIFRYFDNWNNGNYFHARRRPRAARRQSPSWTEWATLSRPQPIRMALAIYGISSLRERIWNGPESNHGQFGLFERPGRPGADGKRRVGPVSDRRGFHRICDEAPGQDADCPTTTKWVTD